ncbi:hypothetical protein MLD38_022276 [Melastoma candidum]|uniref:Uncharacterized protein n=1 Tax=Melastoma candidum TaxID=119954 RepID=A0ACB9QMM6_9MYRT|nr:hypothetical protein MLD38_022276 [Melastoma candidum]
MAASSSSFSFSTLLFLIGVGNICCVAWSASITLENKCAYTVWPGSLSGNGVALLGSGYSMLPPSATAILQAPPGWSGRFWGRTHCTFDDTGAGSCLTGDCGGFNCTGGGSPPVTLVEFTIAGSPTVDDFYDVSLVDGYNVGMGVRATGGTGQCQYAGCVNDLNTNCPQELAVADGTGQAVACRSACEAFQKPEYCCTGNHGTPDTCSPSDYSRMFKSSCPSAYSYAYDDKTSTCTCAGADYVITFCPTQ